jgi:U6 snRNA-associated Sm-like protein LSm4
MVLPLTLLRAAPNHPILVELKSGEAYSGVLGECDGWMNIRLRDAVLTSKDGDRFWRVPDCYIRGNTIKFIRVPEEVVDVAAKAENIAPAADAQRSYHMGQRPPGKGKGKGKGMPSVMPAGTSASARF